MPVIDLGSVVGPQGPQGATGATGAQGIQGNPGPNQVTDQTSTNLNGVLFGNQSRVTVKPVDSTPTADSTNLVSSGGVKTALDTKANQAQLAYVESGTTASQNYTAGQYISWNGLLYTANQAISSGTTLSAGTGGNLTECVGGGFNDVQSFNVSPSSGVTINSQSNYKIGNLVFLYFEFAISSSLDAWASVVTLPFPAFFGAFYLVENGAMPVSQVLYSIDNYHIAKGRNALPAGTYIVSVMGYVSR